MELKFLQVIYESFDCDLTQGLFIHDFNKYIKVKVSPLQAKKAHGDVDARVHIFTATALG